MNKICLFALFIAVASASLAVDIGNHYLPRRTFKCLSNKHVSKVILEFSNEMGHINHDFSSCFIFARDAGISTVDAIVVLNDTFIADSLSAKIAKALPSGFNGTVWLRVINSPQLWSRKIPFRIFYLGDLVTSFKQHDLKVGISADASTWESAFEFKRAGSDTLKSASVWYAHEDNVQSFDDFCSTGFGTWNQAALKNYKKNIEICGIVVPSLNYYKTDTQLNYIHQ